MEGKDGIGHVVWHDLLTNTVPKATRFYADLLGWEYQIEHASDFAWKPGEANYPLILANETAHGGVVDLGMETLSQWVAYVLVEDVDAVAAKAKGLGATLIREPFDTPGVGRSAVIRDSQGAIICPHVSTHNFPPPRGMFLWDELITTDVELSKRFYSALFGWSTKDIARDRISDYTIFQGADGSNVAGAMKRSFDAASLAGWVPYLAIDDIDSIVAKAKTLGSRVYVDATHAPYLGQIAVLADPTDAIFGLLAPLESRQP